MIVCLYTNNAYTHRYRWVHKKHYAPIFTGGKVEADIVCNNYCAITDVCSSFNQLAPHIIWGLTGYIVNRFVRDIIERYDIVFDDSNRA